MSARMPIAAALLQGRHCAYMGAALEQMETAHDDNHEVMVNAVPRKVQEGVLRSLRYSVPFDVQIASELYWGKPKDYYTIDEFEGLRLPYRQVWFEWSIPKMGYFQGRKFEEPSSARFAAHIFEDEELPPGAPATAARQVYVQVLAESNYDQPATVGERPILLNDVAVSFCTDQHGQYVEDTIAQLEPKDLRPRINKQLRGEVMTAAFVCAMALQLINCRNVTTAKAGNIAVRRSGREKRQGVQPVAFHTIVLPGMSVERGKVTKQQAAANEAAIRLHRVRGHFKSFTKEAPLLGKHVGKYWWNPAVRGNARHGKVKQDYRIGETA